MKKQSFLTDSNMSFSKELFSSLVSLIHQGILVLIGLLILLVITSGNPSILLLNCSILMGIVSVALMENRRFRIRKVFINKKRKRAFTGATLEYQASHRLNYGPTIEEILVNKFKNLNNKDRSWMMELGVQRRIPKDNILIQEGKPLENLYIALDGIFEVSSTSSGQEKKLTKLSNGEIMGEMSFVTKRSIATATVKSLEESNVWSIPRILLNDKIREDRDFAARFYEELAYIIATRMNERMNEHSRVISREKGRNDIKNISRQVFIDRRRINKVQDTFGRIFSFLSGNYSSLTESRYDHLSRNSERLSLGMVLLFIFDQEY